MGKTKVKKAPAKKAPAKKAAPEKKAAKKKVTAKTSQHKNWESLFNEFKEHDAKLIEAGANRITFMHYLDTNYRLPESK